MIYLIPSQARGRNPWSRLRYQPSGNIKKTFTRSGHFYYDSKAFNTDELEFAKALDRQEYVWVRNKRSSGLRCPSVPLPIKSGSSSQLFPDFIWWVKKTVWALDTTGKFILDEKIRNKVANGARTSSPRTGSQGSPRWELQASER